MEKGIFWGFLVATFITTMVLGCATLRSWNTNQERKNFIRELRYFKDPRTGLCFATLPTHGGLAVVDKKYCERKSK